MSALLAIRRVSKSRLSESQRENPEFGSVFSDHMFVADYVGGHWGEPEIIPYGPMLLPPSLSALHYGQSVFEGFRARRTVDGGVALFRPRENHARLNRSAVRLAMPEVPESLFLEGVAELVRLDREWIPQREGGALYVRPLYFGTDEALLVQPAKRYRLTVVTCPVVLTLRSPSACWRRKAMGEHSRAAPETSSPPGITPQGFSRRGSRRNAGSTTSCGSTPRSTASPRNAV